MRERAGWAAVATAAAALAGTAIVAALLLWAGGYHPIEAAAAMWSGAFGSTDALVSITLVRAVPFILTGLAVAVAFRAGVWNIGAEGQLYAGAIAAVWVGLNGGGLPAWILVPSVLLAAAVAGALWALVPALIAGFYGLYLGKSGRLAGRPRLRAAVAIASVGAFGFVA